MASGGTAAYENAGELPLLVLKAVDTARGSGFANSCLPSHGRLLQVLAGGVGEGIIGETGTGGGVGLAWLASGARPGVRLVSIEHDPVLAETASTLFEDEPAITILHGDWQQLRAFGPFDLLALDGGGQGKGTEPAIDPGEWLRPGGLVVMDDFTPADGWPPLHDGGVDQARLHWLAHPQLLSAEVRTQPDAATIIATFPGKRLVP
ncbi:MAG: class I SAM-dependent methyltransferase [Mycobacteriales bacterium]